MIKKSDTELINSYIIIIGNFKAVSSLKFPSIPVTVDEHTTIYPLEGSCVLTGSEYVVARNQGIIINIERVYNIPFRCSKSKNKGEGELKVDYKPFKEIMMELQSERRKYPKNSFMNLLLKLLGNTVYGSVSKGLGNVKKFDISTKSLSRIPSGELSNPILAS